MAHGRAPLVGESAQQRVQWRSGRALGTALILLLVPALPLQAQQAPGNTSDGTGGEASAGEPLAGEVERGRYVFQAAGCLGCHRSEEHTSELQSLMRISSAVFCLKNKNNNNIMY